MVFGRKKVLKRIAYKLSKVFNSQLSEITYNWLYENYRDHLRMITPDSPALHGFKSYSQNDEDGIIEEIMRRTGIKQSKFLEIGCGDGKENNTHYLALSGWSGIWIDGRQENIQAIKDMAGEISFESKKEVDIVIKSAFLTRNNVVSEIQNSLNLCGWKYDQIDFLSVDVDGSDIFLCEKIFETFTPSVVCIEYNSIFSPSCKFIPPYQENYVWAIDDYMGASLLSVCELFEQFGYFLVCCNLSGVNAFFVQKRFKDVFEEYSIKDLYMPPRYKYLRAWDFEFGHKRTLKNLASVANFIE